MASKKWTARQTLYIPKCRPRLGPNPGIVDPEVKLWGKSRCGSNRGCAGRTRCSLAGRRSAVTLHWPSCSPQTWLRMTGGGWIVLLGVSTIQSTTFTGVKMAMLCTDGLYGTAETIAAAETSCSSLGLAGGWCSQTWTEQLLRFCMILWPCVSDEIWSDPRTQLVNMM